MQKITVETIISADGKEIVASVQGVQGEEAADIGEILAGANTLVATEATAESAHEHTPAVRQTVQAR